MPLANEVNLTQTNENFKSFSNITRRVLKLGSEKWIPHVKAREMEKNTPDLIVLTIGEPDIPVNKKLVKICSDSMNKGRTRYSDRQTDVKHNNLQNNVKLSLLNILNQPDLKLSEKISFAFLELKQLFS